MAPPLIGEQFSSAPITKAIPPHLRKKAINSGLSSTPVAEAGQGSSGGSLTTEMTPSTESTYTALPSSSPSPAGHSGLPEVNIAVVGEVGFRSRAELQALGMPSSTTSRSAGHARSNGSSDGGAGPPLQRYQPEDLIDIAKQCSGRLPPASAVQAMFLYEMQRETESERLFEGQMFRLAKSEDELVAQARRHAKMEARVAALEKQVAMNAVQARIAATDFRIDVQQQRLAEHADRLQKVEESLASVPESLQTLQQTHDQFAADTAAALGDVVHHATSAAQMAVAADSNQISTPEFNVMKQELDVLFTDRDGILFRLAEVNERMQHLAENIHQLTIQKTVAQTIYPTPVQRLPVFGLNGDLVDVAVPKGKPAVGLDGSPRPTVKTFVPGKPWGA